MENIIHFSLGNQIHRFDLSFIPDRIISKAFREEDIHIATDVFCDEYRSGNIYGCGACPLTMIKSNETCQTIISRIRQAMQTHHIRPELFI